MCAQTAHDDWFPAPFYQTYELMKRLSDDDRVLLARRRDNGALFVARVADAAEAERLRTETEILKTLHHPALPVFEACFETNSHFIELHEYIPGVPLSAYAGRNTSPDRALRIGLSICDILIYLQSLTPPVVHRDIKPKNVIVKPDGSIALVDFDIASRYDPAQNAGASSVNAHTDVCALGMLLIWLMTGESERAQGLSKIASPLLRRTLDGCVASSPGHRCKDARRARRALRLAL